MLTLKQKKWLSILSSSDKVEIKPLDLTANEKFEKVKNDIQSFLKEKINIEHHGSTALSIPGQDEIDIYIPVNPSDFEDMINRLKPLYGELISIYQNERARFSTIVDSKKIDIYVMNKEWKGWIDGLIFENYLTTHPDDLNAYIELKKRNVGKSIQEYYKDKIEFINTILEKSKLEK